MRNEYVQSLYAINTLCIPRPLAPSTAVFSAVHCGHLRRPQRPSTPSTAAFRAVHRGLEPPAYVHHAKAFTRCCGRPWATGRVSSTTSGSNQGGCVHLCACTPLRVASRCHALTAHRRGEGACTHFSVTGYFAMYLRTLSLTDYSCLHSIYGFRVDFHFIVFRRLRLYRPRYRMF